jgi:hypothetical protein
MPILLARENMEEQLPRMMVGTRVSAFECQADEITERDNAYFTTSIYQPEVEIELEYLTVADLLKAAKVAIDEQVVRTLLQKRVLPFITVDVYTYRDRFGLHLSAMTIGEATAICIGSCLLPEEDEEDDDDAETLGDYHTRMALAESEGPRDEPEDQPG